MTLIEEAQEIASTRGVRISNRRVSAFSTPLLVQCDAGHQLKVPFVRFIDSEWKCRFCAKDALRASVQRALTKRGWQFGADDAVSNNHPIDVTCDRGHSTRGTCKSILNGKAACRQCLDDDQFDQVRQIARGNAGEALSSYVHTDSERYVVMRCKDNHQWAARIHSVLAGHWCKRCSVRQRRKTIQDAHDLAKANGAQCLSKTMRDGRSAVQWRCASGHRFARSLAAMSNAKNFCPKCNGGDSVVRLSAPAKTPARSARDAFDSAKHIARSRGGACLSTEYRNNHEKLRWVCEDGHQWEATQANVVHRNSWCPTCARSQRWRASVKAIAEEFQATVLTEHLDVVRPLVEWRCKAGHEFKRSVANIRSSYFCPACRKAEKGRRSLQRLAKRMGGECLSETYDGPLATYRWRCRDNHLFDDTAKAVEEMGCGACQRKSEELALGRAHRASSLSALEKAERKDRLRLARQVQKDDERLERARMIAAPFGFSVSRDQYRPGTFYFSLQCPNGHRTVRRNIMSKKWRGNCPQCTKEERTAYRAKKRAEQERNPGPPRQAVRRRGDELGEVAPLLVNDDKAAFLLGISKKTLQNKIAKGANLPPHIAIPGSRRRWLVDDIKAWVLNLAHRDA